MLQQLLQGLEVVIKVVEQLNSGKPEGVRQLCADFVQGAKVTAPPCWLGWHPPTHPPARPA